MTRVIGIEAWNWGRMMAEGKSYTSLLLCGWHVAMWPDQ